MGVAPLGVYAPDRDAIVCGQAELRCYDSGISALIGLDEAGRGPLAGPVACAACALPWPTPVTGLDDSKKLDETERVALFDQIIAKATAFAVVLVEPDVIDSVNILRASLLGMAQAWATVVQHQPALRGAVALVDGKMRAPLPDSVTQHPLVQGDARSVNIAAASILAKVSRDRVMVSYDAIYPGYGFAQHKGYPTPAHRQAVAKLGPTPIHRRSFRLPGVEKPAVQQTVEFTPPG